ncbi:hypothetical protein J6590_036564 [Homalodisca vitripennis]|nr:hypothetical protein J6590_036564 [Homalodisca vitripennis]
MAGNIFVVELCYPFLEDVGHRGIHHCDLVAPSTCDLFGAFIRPSRFCRISLPGRSLSLPLLLSPSPLSLTLSLSLSLSLPLSLSPSLSPPSLHPSLTTIAVRIQTPEGSPLKRRVQTAGRYRVHINCWHNYLPLYFLCHLSLEQL